MGQIYMPTQSEKAQAHENQPMERSRDIVGIFKKISNPPVENIETLSPKKKVENFFSKSGHGRACGQLLEMVEMTWGTRLLSGDMDSY